MPYLGRGPNFGVRTVFHYLASNGDTSVSGADADGKSMSFVDGNYIDVYLNGVRLKSGEDYNTGTANTVAGLSALNANDEVNVVVYDTFTVADTVKASEGGTFSGDVTTTGTFNVTGDTAAGDDASIGHTSAEGLILTGQGTTNDVTIKNDADTAVVQIPTGTDDVNFTDDVTLKSDSAVLGFGADSDITLTHAADTGLTLNGTFTSTGLASTTSGTSNFVAGVNAGNSIASGGNYNVTIGDEAGTAINTGDNNTVVGYQAGDAITTGGGNVAIGSGALSAGDTDSNSVAVGYNALASLNVGGNSNVAVGYNALTNNVSGGNNTAIGTNALTAQNTSGGASDTHNTAVGNSAGSAVTSGTNNVFIGSLAGAISTTSSHNVAIGYGSFGGVDGSAAQTGQQNVCIGRFAGRNLEGDADNGVLIGDGAGENMTTGDGNICIGHDAGITGSPGGNITTGGGEIALGDNTIASFSCKVSLTATSDERDKTDFKDLDLGLDFVKALKPVTYVWDSRLNYVDKTKDDWKTTVDLDKVVSDGSKKDDDLQVGFKAQDVIALEDSAGYKLSDKTNLTATLTSDGKQYGLRYERFVPMLVKAVQELSAKNDALEARIKTLEDG